MGTGMGWHHIVLADLPGSQRHFGVLGLAELCQLMEDGRQLICQRGVTATQLVLQCHTTMARLSSGSSLCGMASSQTPAPHRMASSCIPVPHGMTSSCTLAPCSQWRRDLRH